MKSVLFVFFASVSLTLFSQNEDVVMKLHELPKWEQTFQIAKNKAKKENKPILIYFSGSDWCGPCIKLDKELFHTKEFVDFSKNKFILYLADFPRNKDLVSEETRKINAKLARKYKNSFPSVVIINRKGKVLGERKGSYLSSSYYSFFESVLH
ncbi:thioredoxin family protein [Tenacibaculum sp. C7A-26P2]|uniref:thioredoxin family protein n=1 Tax=Tenacibaculum sp. C7A-26P2 TaxID=3447504 RepID=UPI003F82AD52